MIRRTVVLLSVIVVSMIPAGCGSSPSEPGVPTPSFLSVEFTGTIEVPDALCRLTADWTQCPDGDFHSYRLFRSQNPGIPQDTSGAVRLGTFTGPEQTTFDDSGVSWGETCHYALLTLNRQGVGSWSGEVQFSTPPCPMPAGMIFVTIPAGSFQMGSPEGDPGSFASERPVHTVTFDHSFEMMTTEVTQAMWNDLLEGIPADPSHFTGAELPVEHITWEGCQVFIEAMNSLDPCHNYRLPSEAEWEYACRAGTTSRFYWGDDLSYSLIGEYAWYNGNSGDESHPVASKEPNAWGLFDMSGNVAEWCQDTWHSNYEGAPSDGGVWEGGASSHVIRGGGWIFSGRFCRSAHREHINPENRYNWLGFRLVRTVR